MHAPYGRTRWVEYPTVSGVWALEDKYDASMVHPDWHGWLHYMHDIPGQLVSLEFSKPFKQHHRVNQTMLRPYYTTPAGITSKHHEEGAAPAYHMPPGAWGNPKPRGRLGPKYQAWDPDGGEKQPNLLRCALEAALALRPPSARMGRALAQARAAACVAQPRSLASAADRTSDPSQQLRRQHQDPRYAVRPSAAPRGFGAEGCASAGCVGWGVCVC